MMGEPWTYWVVLIPAFLSGLAVGMANRRSVRKLREYEQAQQPVRNRLEPKVRPAGSPLPAPPASPSGVSRPVNCLNDKFCRWPDRPCVCPNTHPGRGRW